MRLGFIGHTNYSHKLIKSPFGEITNALKLRSALSRSDLELSELSDIYELFGINDLQGEDVKQLDEMQKMNQDLAQNSDEIIEDFNNPLTKRFLQNVKRALHPDENTVLYYLTPPNYLYAVLGTGLHKQYPVISRCYCWHPSTFGDTLGDNVAYEKTALCVSQSLLGVLECLKKGMPPWKVAYLPNTAPEETRFVESMLPEDRLESKVSYLNEIAERMGKKQCYDEKTFVIGYPVRFLRCKNVELLIEAAYQLQKKYPHIVIVLKGNYSPYWDHGSMYSHKLSQILRTVQGEPWFLWDESFTPYPEVLKTFSLFDLCTFLSGSEIASNTLLELLSLGIPTLAPKATVYPYLYHDMLEYVDVAGMVEGTIHFMQPRIDSLVAKIESFIVDEEKGRRLGKRAREIAQRRFGAEQVNKRMPLFVKAAHSIFHGAADAEECKETLKNLLYQDIEEYGLKDAFDKFCTH
jgi:glycosyltransferase involved in cell wall biosynthesis